MATVQNLRINTLGRFDLEKGEQSLYAQTNHAKKIWELFAFLFTYRGKSFTPEALVDQLWLGESYQDPRATLRRQMHRMRKLLNETTLDSDQFILFSNGSYRWNPQISVDVDVDVFESLIKQGEAHLNKSNYDPLAALKPFEQAIDLYKGDYLPDFTDQHWVFSVRHQYRRLYLKAVDYALQLQKSLNLSEAMIETASKAVQIDIYEEHFHHVYLDALLGQGNTKEALVHYEYITRFYYQEMGVSPSPQLKQLYKRLLAQQASQDENCNNTSGQSNAKSPRESAPDIPSDQILESLEEEGPIQNAYCCNPTVFKSLYELERRRSYRSGQQFSVAVLNMLSRRDDTIAQSTMRNVYFKNHLAERLRLGDTFAQWGIHQYVVLLPGVDESLVYSVVERVLSEYEDKQRISIEGINYLPAPTTDYIQ